MGSNQSSQNDGIYKGGVSKSAQQPARQSPAGLPTPSASAAPAPSAAPPTPVGAEVEELKQKDANAMMRSWGRNLAHQIRLGTIALLAPEGSSLRGEVANIDVERLVEELKNTVDRDYYRRISYLVGFMHAFTDSTDAARSDRLADIMYRTDLDANEQDIRDRYDVLEDVRMYLGLHVEIALELLKELAQNGKRVDELQEAFKDNAEAIGLALDSNLDASDAFYSKGLMAHANLTIEQALATKQDKAAESIAKGAEIKELLIAFSERLAQALDNILVPAMNGL